MCNVIEEDNEAKRTERNLSPDLDPILEFPYSDAKNFMVQQTETVWLTNIEYMGSKVILELNNLSELRKRIGRLHT